MNAQELIDYASNNGLKLTIVGPRLTLTGNRVAANDEFLAHLKARKAEVMALMRKTPERVVVPFQLINGGGGSIIDPGGSVAAIRDLIERYGARLDLADLLERFEERAALMEYDGGLNRLDAEREALQIIRRLAEKRA